MEQREVLLKDIIKSKEKIIQSYKNRILELQFWIEREKKSLKSFKKELKELFTNNPTE